MFHELKMVIVVAFITNNNNIYIYIFMVVAFSLRKHNACAVARIEKIVDYCYQWKC